VDGGTATTQLLTSGSSTFTLTSPNAGDHSLSASYTAQGNFAASSAIGTLHVNQASQTITVTAPNPFPSNATYGASFTASATGGGSGNAVMIFGSGSCGGSGNDSALITMTSGTGSCTVTFNQMGNTNYSAASQVSKSVTALLAPQTIAFTDPATAPALGDGNFTEGVSATSGEPVTVTSTTPDVCKVNGDSNTGTSPTSVPITIYSAGTCTLSATVGSDPNYSAAGPITHSVTIGKYIITACPSTGCVDGQGNPTPGAYVTISGSVPYLGQATATVTLTPDSVGNLPLLKPVTGDSTTPKFTVYLVQVDSGGNPIASPILFGSGKATQTTSPAGYQVTIQAALPDTIVPPNTYKAYVYGDDGSTLTSAAVPADEGYTAVDTANFVYPTLISGTLTITKAPSTTSFTSTAPSQLAYNGTYTPTATSTGDGTLTIGASGACSITGGVVTITAGSGTCTVTATESEGNNHLGSSATAQTITAIKATATVTVNSATVQFDGSSHSVTASTTPSGLTVSITYDGSATAPMNVKIVGGAVSGYAVVATISDTNYQGSGSGTLTINKAPASVGLSNLNQTYTGSPLAATATTSPAGLPVMITYNPVTPINPGLYTVNATVANPNYSGGNTDTLTISDVAPSVTITAPASGYIVAVNTNVTFTGTFSDIGPKGPYTAKFTFDGGTTVPGTLTPNAIGPSGTVTANYTFTSAGVYNVVLAVTDGYNKTGTATTVNNDSTSPAYIVVYDPNGGFVTGGGWINSPVNAYAANPSLTGKANFGFVSKYQKGATIPTGETEFNFQVGNLNFHSSSYDWLVISGTQAQYKGTGTINGSGNYKFMLTASDGNPDGFRIKITNPADGSVVYDNKPLMDDGMGNTQPLGGGSIVIHK